MIPSLTSSHLFHHLTLPFMSWFRLHLHLSAPQEGLEDSGQCMHLQHVDDLDLGLLCVHGSRRGDWGSLITTVLGTSQFSACKLINLSMSVSRPPPLAMLGLGLSLLFPTSFCLWLLSKIYSEDECRVFARLWSLLKTGRGYYLQQLTWPFTIGSAIGDSSLGVLAWVGRSTTSMLTQEYTLSHRSRRIFLLPLRCTTSRVH
jgi:hypothetical protein